MLRTISIYAIIITLFAGASWLVIDFGNGLPPAIGETPPLRPPAPGTATLAILLAQITVTLAAARAMGWVARRA